MTFGFPEVVAFNLDKSTCSMHRFSLNETPLSVLLYSIVIGRTASYELENAAQLSNILVDVSELDEINGEIDEEEFYLSHIIGDVWHTDL